MIEVKEITPDEVKNLLDSEEKVLIVDVRTKEEYNQVHIKGALLIELCDFNQEKLEEKCHNIKDLSKIIFQCRSGVRSKTAIELLNKDFPYETYNLKGGIILWSSYGYKTIINNIE